MTEGAVEYISDQNDSPLTNMKLSRDKSFLIGYVNDNSNEHFHIYNTVKNEKIWEGVLDLQEGENIREDPTKLL